MAGVWEVDQPSFVAKTVVTTNLLVDLAQHYGVEVRETLTGFKYIAEAIRKRRANVNTWSEAKKAMDTSWEIRFATRMRFKAAVCSRSWPMSWTSVVSAC